MKKATAQILLGLYAANTKRQRQTEAHFKPVDACFVLNMSEGDLEASCCRVL